MSAAKAVALQSVAWVSQANDIRALSSDARDKLIISEIRVDGHWVIQSRYKDFVWALNGMTTNRQKCTQHLDFAQVPEPFLATMKNVFYRYMRRGLDGGKRPASSTTREHFSSALRFLRYLMDLGIYRLADVTPMVCSAYVQACRAVGGGCRKTTLSKGTLARRFMTVEILYNLSQYTSDLMPRHPWPDSSASALSGKSRRKGASGSEKTPLIPDQVFSILFQRAWSVVQDAPQLLDLRDELEQVKHRMEGADRKTIARHQNAVLEIGGWTAGLDPFNAILLEIRIACYIVIASLTGCRNHEMAFLRSQAWYSTVDDEGSLYKWMRSRSQKTGEGDTQWMIPEAAVTALEVIDRWAAPLQKMLQQEIIELRKVDPRSPSIADAQLHVDAVFVGASMRKRNQVRTLSTDRHNKDLKAFAQACGLDWKLASHQFRRKFANYAARSQFGDLRYLREHFKHWSMDMTLGYALNESQEMALYMEIRDELDDIKAGVAEIWFNPSEPLAGGYGQSIVNWRGSEAITLFKDRKQMILSIAQSTAIRSNGHAWCTADDDLCVGNDMERTRCGSCSNAVIGRQHEPLYQRLYDELKEVLECNDIGEGGKARVRRDLDRCRAVLTALGYDPEVAHPAQSLEVAS